MTLKACVFNGVNLKKSKEMHVPIYEECQFEITTIALCTMCIHHTRYIVSCRNGNVFSAVGVLLFVITK